MKRDLDAVIKAYDVRGLVPEQLDGDLAERLGGAFARVTGASAAEGGPGAVIVAHDMRPSGPELVERFCAGVTAQGVDVVNIGLASTDMAYFASGQLELPGAMFTASHNPAGYNGIKFCRARAVPVATPASEPCATSSSTRSMRPKVSRPAASEASTCSARTPGSSTCSSRSPESGR